MPTAPEQDSGRTKDPSLHPFRRAVLRGVALLLPPLLTIVIFVWVWNTVREYILLPVETGSRNVIVWAIADIRDSRPEQGQAEGIRYQEVNRQYIPVDVYRKVESELGPEKMPGTALEIYNHYVEIRYLKWYIVITVFLCVLILVLYLLGKFLAAGIGRMMWNVFDQVIHRLPIIRNVYGSVKQVTDFVFSERDIEYTRVVAIEYPRKGIWSLGFVTGESMLDIRSAANEPVLSVLMPTSPMPATGFTVTVRKSETVDLNITIDQAFQFIISCGVVVPPQQVQNEVSAKIATALAEREVSGNGESDTKALAAPAASESDTSG